LNLGAGKSVVLENHFVNSGLPFVCDRVDIENFQISGYNVRNCYQCSAESMHLVKSEEYNAVYSNYVLEHAQDITKVASEIYRILKPGGIFVASVPNPTAPEFLLAKRTSLWFHKMVRGREAWETYYAYKNIKTLKAIFQKAGFDHLECLHWSFLTGYMGRFVILNELARLYDKILNIYQVKKFMNTVCVVFKKPFLEGTESSGYNVPQKLDR
jgi:SAM-dependent methyltransferase